MCFLRFLLGLSNNFRVHFYRRHNLLCATSEDPLARVCVRGGETSAESKDDTRTAVTGSLEERRAGQISSLDFRTPTNGFLDETGKRVDL